MVGKQKTKLIFIVFATGGELPVGTTSELKEAFEPLFFC